MKTLLKSYPIADRRTDRHNVCDSPTTPNSRFLRGYNFQSSFSHGDDGRKYSQNLGDSTCFQDERIERRKYPVISSRSLYITDSGLYYRLRNEIALSRLKRSTRRNGQQMASFSPMLPPPPKSPSTPSPPQNYALNTQSSSAQWHTHI